MDTAIVFGTVKRDENSTTYTAPANLPKETLKRISFDNQPIEKIKERKTKTKLSEVTHRVFFGENIKRAINILKNGQ
jgi:hypothetical protein